MHDDTSPASRAADDDQIPPAHELIFRIGRVFGDLEFISQMITSPDLLSFSEPEQQRMHDLLGCAQAEVDELFDLASAAVQAPAAGDRSAN